MPCSRLLAAAAVLLAAACAESSLTDSALPAPDDPVLLARALAVEVDVARGTVRVRNPSAVARLQQGPSGPRFALLGGNEVGLSLGPVTRTSVSSTRDNITFDATVLNKLLNVDLVTPTFPAPPATPGVFLVPFAVSVTSGSGAIRANAGTFLTNNPAGVAERWNFFNDVGCPPGSNDCLPFAMLAPLAAGGSTGPAHVGFLADKTVQTFTVYFILAADLHERPLPTGTGAIAGVVTGVDVGALAGVTVDLDGAATTTTDANGYYAFTAVPAGSHQIFFSGQPAFCTTVGLVASVTAGNLITANAQLACTGSVSGSVMLGTTAVGGVVVEAASGTTTTTATTNVLGVYSFPALAPGSYQIRLTSGLPTGCTVPTTRTVDVRAGQVTTNGYVVSCLGTLTGGVFDGTSAVPISGARVDGLGLNAVFTNSNGHYVMSDVTAGSGTLTATPPSSVPWCLPMTQNYSVSSGQTTILYFSLACQAAPAIQTTSIPQATAGIGYSFTLQATPNGLIWSAPNGMPPGLSLSSSGGVTGTPTQGFSGTFNARVRDAFGRTDNQAISISVIVPPDAFEPNDALTAPTALASLDRGEGAFVLANFHTTADKDFFSTTFRVDFGGGFCLPGTTIQRTASMTLTTPGVFSSDYDLYVYDNSGNQIASSTAGVGVTDVVNLDISHICGTATTQVPVVIEVRRFTGPPISDAYRLTLTVQP